MEVLIQRCAGLDVHKASVVAAVRWVEGGKLRRLVRTFGTTTSDLVKLSDWLLETGCTHVAMEATGIYWKPIWAVLEAAEAFELILANAKHVKNVPGRKTDVKDAEWLSDLLAYGLIRASFVPPKHVQQMRDLSRTRVQFVREITAHTLRIQKVLEVGNMKLSSVLSDILGESGRAILKKLSEGVTAPEKLAALMNYRVKASREEVIEALTGTFTPHQSFLLKLHLTQIETLEKAVRDLEARLSEELQPFRADLERVAQIPGLDTRSASAVLAEIGTDMSRFENPDKLVSWSTICPRMDESAGKKRNTRIAKGGRWLKPLLVQAAWAAVRTKDSYLRAKYLRIKGKRGVKKALIAVAASILRIIWHILAEGVRYKDLGPEYFHRSNKEKSVKAMVMRLRNYGYNVTLEAAA